jgi:ABC-2 type transport system ATP-binding protein
MMLEAANVSKFYGARQALDSVSFSVARGEAVAFLGMDGAGKSTVMRILSGFLAPTHGAVRVGGKDPRRAATRQCIGYLPGTNPLPPRSRVREYLRFRAGLKGLTGKRGAAAVAETAETCGIGGEMDRMIGSLSREARRRVGLAECVVAKPSALLLDDPAAGLDPHEARRVRELVERLGQGIAVLLSGSDPEDAGNLCRRAILLDRGRIAADGDLAAILDRSVEERVVTFDVICSEPVRETLRAVPGVLAVSAAPRDDAPGVLAIRATTPAGVDPRRDLSLACARRGWLITSMRMEPVRLEDIFRKPATRRSI